MCGHVESITSAAGNSPKCHIEIASLVWKVKVVCMSCSIVNFSLHIPNPRSSSRRNPTICEVNYLHAVAIPISGRRLNVRGVARPRPRREKDRSSGVLDRYT